MTSSVTSTPRSVGRQCMNHDPFPVAAISSAVKRQEEDVYKWNIAGETICLRKRVAGLMGTLLHFAA